MAVTINKTQTENRTKTITIKKEKKKKHNMHTWSSLAGFCLDRQKEKDYSEKRYKENFDANSVSINE